MLGFANNGRSRLGQIGFTVVRDCSPGATAVHTRDTLRAQQEQATTEIQRQEQAAPAPEAGEREQWQEQAALARGSELQRPEPAAPRNLVQVEKRVRAISKKLKVAREQREAKANGQRLNVDQEAKIAGIPE